MDDAFLNDQQVSDYLATLGMKLVEDSCIKDLCRHPYRSSEVSEMACRALTQYLDHRKKMPVEYLAEIAAFLEGQDYAPARQALIQARNSLQPVIERGDTGIMVVTADAKKAWSAVRQAIDHLGKITSAKDKEVSWRSTLLEVWES